MDKHIDGFMSYLRAERHYSEQTIMVYGPVLYDFAAFIDPNGMGVDWRSIQSADIREWMVNQMEQGDSASTMNKRLSAMRSFYRYLMLSGVCDADPASKVNGPKKEKALPYFVREKDMDRLLDDVVFPSGYEGARDKLILLLFYSTGMRLAELVGLNIGSVDFYSGAVKVLGKRNKERIIPFGPELRTALEQYMPLRAQQPLAQGTPAFFVGTRVARITRGSVGKIVKKYLSLVTTIKKRSPHVLRHSFATAMLNNGAEIEVVKQLLGHESISTTEIYTHTTFEELKKAYRQAHPHAEEEKE